MNPRRQSSIDAVIELLTRLAQGELDARVDRSETDDDDLDAVIAGINMLAEELSANRSELEDRVEARTHELEEARAAAQESSRLKSEFLATMSHEIRTPMNGVIGLTSLLLDTPLGIKQRQYAEGVREAGEGLLAVINDILDFSKLEAGKVRLESADFDPRRIVEDVASLLAVEAHGKHLELVAFCAADVPELVTGDAGRVRQVLLNLASNAVKFTASGEVSVTARAVQGTDGRARLRLEVSDTGIGIPVDVHPRLFESFSQADASTTRRFGGTGLGLAISRRLTEAMEGAIGMESVPGASSVFWFEVPLVVSTPSPAAAPHTGQGPLSGVAVLVVDDNATSRRVLESQLSSAGLRPYGVADPRLAVPLMHDAVGSGRPYAVALLDVQMPQMDGLALARSISAHPSLLATRLILLESRHHLEPEELRRTGEVAPSLAKPVRRSELFDLLEAVMRPEAGPPISQPAPEMAGTVAPGWNGRVLVVEDNALNQMVAEGVLIKLGYQADIAENGIEALEAISAISYSAVLMDCHMPLMDGFAATEEIRRRDSDGDRLPVIAMTAAAMAEDFNRCMDVGMDGFVSKPITVEAVDDALTRWARKPVQDDVVPVIDARRQSALRHLGPDDGWGILPMAVAEFTRDSRTILEAMRMAVERGDAEAFAEGAHQLKGAAVDLGLLRVVRLCGLVESAGSSASAPGSDLLDELEAELDLALQRLQQAVLPGSPRSGSPRSGSPRPGSPRSRLG